MRVHIIKIAMRSGETQLFVPTDQTDQLSKTGVLLLCLGICWVPHMQVLPLILNILLIKHLTLMYYIPNHARTII